MSKPEDYGPEAAAQAAADLAQLVRDYLMTTNHRVLVRPAHYRFVRMYELIPSVVIEVELPAPHANVHVRVPMDPDAFPNSQLMERRPSEYVRDSTGTLDLLNDRFTVATEDPREELDASNPNVEYMEDYPDERPN